MMKPEERIYTAMSGKIPDRVPVVPKIWVDLAARMTGTRLTEVITDPLTALRVIVEAGVQCHVDGVRQFHFPKRRIIEKEGKVLEVDDQGRILGDVDMLGGLMTYLVRCERLSSPRPLHHGPHPVLVVERALCKKFGRGRSDRCSREDLL